MKGEGASITRRILEYLIVHLQYDKQEQPDGFSTSGGMLVVSVDIEDSVQYVNQLHCATLIAAKGDFCHKLLSDQTRKEMEGLLPLCQSKALSGRGCPHESLHTMPFQLSFELYEKSEDLKEDCLALKQFIHRISLVHTTIKFHYCVKMNGYISTKTYSTERRASTRLPDGTRLLSEGSHFVSKAIWACDKIHPTAGEPVGLFIPEEIAEKGFSGELKLTPVMSLCPCQKQLPNQPVRITAVSIFLYDPAGLPILLPTEEVSHSFFGDPSWVVPWERYGYQATLDSDPYWEEDTAMPDVRYKLHTSHKPDLDTQEQTLLLFLFLRYSDPFQDQPVYNSWDQRMILSHIYPIFLCSEQAVKGAIQGVAKSILEQHHKVVQEQQKLTHSLPIMVDAISSIISSSTDSAFRRRCLQHLQVADTQELQVTIRETFSKATLKRWRPSSTCDVKRPKNDEARQLSTLPSAHQKPPCPCVSSTGLEQGTHESSGVEGLWFNKPDFARMSQTRKRRPAREELPPEGSRDPDAEAKGKRDGLLTEPDMPLSSSFSSPPATRLTAILDNSDGRFAAPPVDSAENNENLWQDTEFWNQEVSNLFRWTP
ncbi:type 2 DNA topoisomerase 6 subunit B-like isoform X3 [Hemicordylus capensis]|uniref:type 2 DNA topoisomerase 6 subunit B-like isoform X3 n=1 Tax=Hemicordylus capensis TaxID=884348 RepID=UPI002303CB2B|nr:type 2 DNA topoisomerase 6 subunit B-like isoform X3 [Hemicordylus capensis]